MNDTLAWKKYYTTLPDGGPFYTETNTDHYIVEPWNALSSLAIVIPAIYWLIRIRKNIKDNLFIAFCIPLLALGGTGSTLFHAFRSSSFLLVMDWLPIVILSFAVSMYLWQRVTKRWWLTAMIGAGGFTIRYLLFRSATFSHHTSINIGYFISGLMIFLPALIVLVRTQWIKWWMLAVSVSLWGIALFFREADASGMFTLPMGTHFLWHIFSGIGAFFLADYLYHISRQKV